ncbi:MAG: hypothetical protein M5U34_04965 [Chloroflexi bacterium]|nr:hypothetical protein [Chloroflexota bacterium]
MHLPGMGRYSVNNQSLFWLRVRLLHQDEYTSRMKPYRTTPRLRQVAVHSWGSHTCDAFTADQKEFLGLSDGSPGQTFQLQVTPILKRRPLETLIVQIGEEIQSWQEVANFAESSGEDHCFTLDSITGELRLGPAVRQPNGTMRQYGAIPTRRSDSLPALSLRRRAGRQRAGQHHQHPQNRHSLH